MALLVVGFACSGWGIYFFYSTSAFNKLNTQLSTDIEWKYAPPRDDVRNNAAKLYAGLLIFGIAAIGTGCYLYTPSNQKANILTLNFTYKGSPKPHRK